MYDDPKRYDNDDYYEDEVLDTENEYEADDYDYIVDDEDEDSLWDEEEDADDLPRKKRKKKTVFADSDTDSDDAELYEKTRRPQCKNKYNVYKSRAKDKKE